MLGAERVVASDRMWLVTGGVRGARVGGGVTVRVRVRVVEVTLKCTLCLK